MAFSRRRVALACTYCRHRKRRCDAGKPSCANCIESQVDCQYDDAPSQRIDTSGGSREILSRLRDIHSILEGQAESLASLSLNTGNARPDMATTSPESHSSIPFSQSTGTPAAPFLVPDLEAQEGISSLPPLIIPEKHRSSSSYLLSLPPTKALIGEYPPGLFFLLESKNPLPPPLSLEKWSYAPPPLIDRQATDYLVSVFFSTVHQNHPILDEAKFSDLYEQFLHRGVDTSVESALCMVVLALGSAAIASSGFDRFRDDPPGMDYMQQALPILIGLSSWSFTQSILLPQALVLASVYFAYIVRPLQSWRLIHSACTLLQFKLSGLDGQMEGPDSYEPILRLFWSCFLIECDRLAELELPRSGLLQLTDETSLPSCSNLDSFQSTCYLAEISIRRLLNRIHNSLYPRKQHVLSLSSTTLMATDDFSINEITSMQSVCDELRRQLDEWHLSIPEPYRPSLGSEPLESDRQVVLRIRYYAARHIIYRPFVLYIVTHDTIPVSDSILEKAAMCIESCRSYLRNTANIMRRPSPYTWTFSLSSLGAIVVLTLSSLCPTLKHLVPDINELQTITINNVRPWASSSLDVVISILEDMQRKQRILSRVQS
ncbi:putative C6 finger domain protein [Thozetella sp. PMI_491]|nr:putative C6 finger domain protein [Thozetella sp. PMI_491]